MRWPTVAKVGAAASLTLIALAPSAHASPTGNPYFIQSSVAVAGGCEAWMNGNTDNSGGFYTQAIMESWGDACTLTYSRSHYGCNTNNFPEQSGCFKDTRFLYGGSGRLNTNWYWDGSNYLTWVCVYDVTQGVGSGGGGSSPSRGDQYCGSAI